MNYFQNLARSIFGLNLTNGLFTSYTYDRKNPILIDIDNKLAIYNTIPHLQAVVNTLGDMFKNMEVKLVDVKTGEYVDQHPVLDLIRKPNPLRTFEEFLFEYYVFKSIFGNAFIYQIKGLPSALPSVMWNLLPTDVEVIPTGNLYNQTTLEGIIKYYKLRDQNNIIKVLPNDMIYKNEGVGGNLITSQSKVDGLQLPLSNIIGALKSENVLIVERGAEGILSNTSSADGGAIPLGKEERQRVEQATNDRYGIHNGQQRRIVTNANLSWQPMTFPMKDLMLLECIENDFQAVCAAYGADRDIFPSTKGATFENKNNGLKATYQNTIQPQADDFMSILTHAFGLFQQGLKLEACYEYLPIMQEDDTKRQSAFKTQSEALDIQYKDGAISIDEYRANLGLEPLVKAAEVTQSIEDKIANAQVSLRGTVGGVDGLIGLSASVANGTMDRSAAIAIAMNVYGFDAATANSVITTTILPPPPQNNSF